jgi:excisionase family DNA binding protein
VADKEVQRIIPGAAAWTERHPQATSCPRVDAMGDGAIEWMSSGDAADFLGVGLRTLYKFIDDGKLPGYRFGRVIRLKRADVEAFIESCRIEPGTLEHLRADPSSSAG